jgi:hypothetical protein
MPTETFEEVKDGGRKVETDLLYAWVRDTANKAAILLEDEVVPQLVQEVTARYAPDLRDDELDAIGRDPFLIAHALADPANRCVVTTEVSKRTTRRQNRRIPDVCEDMNVRCVDTFSMLKALNFTTRWQN